MRTHLEGFFTAMKNLVSADDIVTSDRIKRIASTHDGLVYLKRDFLYRRRRAWGRVPRAALFDRTNAGRLMVIGHSDFGTSTFDVRMLRLSGVRAVIGSNTVETRWSRSVPIGLSNHNHTSRYFEVLGNSDHLRTAYDTPHWTDTGRGPHGGESCVYVNVSPSTAPRHRQLVIDLARQRTVCTVEEPSFDASGRVRYLSQLRRHTFVACPRGNGFDTHRFWESLYMGSIPIVLDSPMARSTYRDLPVVFARSWTTALDRTYLEQELATLRTRTFDPAPLAESHWSRYLPHAASAADLTFGS